MPAATVSGVAPTVAVASVTGGSISGPMPYFTVGADDLVAVTHDIDAERDRLARLIGPVLMIGRDGDGDATERLPYLLRRGTATSEARPIHAPTQTMSRRAVKRVGIGSTRVARPPPRRQSMRPDDTRNRRGAVFRGADVVSEGATAVTRRLAGDRCVRWWVAASIAPVVQSRVLSSALLGRVSDWREPRAVQTRPPAGRLPASRAESLHLERPRRPATAGRP